MNRLQLLLCGILPLLVFAAVTLKMRTCQAEEVSWLSDVTRPNLPADPPRLRPILVDNQGRPITTLEAWQERRKDLLQDWTEFLGIYPQSEAPLQIERLESDKLEHCTRTLIRYQIEPGRKVRAYLLTPHRGPVDEGAETEKLPAVVAFHATSNTTFQKLVGLDGEEERHLGLRLAEQGFVVICPENYLWEEETLPDSVAKVLDLHPGSKGMAVMLMDGMRAVDVLETLPEVDPNRIATFGHSLGAKEAMYLAAFDPRIKAAVASEGGTAMDSTNWEAPWYLGPEAKEESFERDHHELIALIAPRPFLVLGGESGPGAADGDRSWPHLAVGQEVARLYGLPVRIGLWNHGEGHRISPASGEKMLQWLSAYTQPTE